MFLYVESDCLCQCRTRGRSWEAVGGSRTVPAAQLRTRGWGLVDGFLSGPDAEQFNISNGGLLSFKSTKDFESSAAKKFVVTIRVTDGQTMVQRSVIIQINNILENNFGETKLGISKIN